MEYCKKDWFNSGTLINTLLEFHNLLSLINHGLQKLERLGNECAEGSEFGTSKTQKSSHSQEQKVNEKCSTPC